MLKTKTLRVVENIDEPEANINDSQVLKEAMKPPTGECEKVDGIERLVGKKQNMIIESYGVVDDVDEWITSLAVLLVKYDSLLKGFINKLRAQYANGKKEFSFSVAAWNEDERKIICDIFKNELCGIVDSIMIDKNHDIISGNLIFSAEARKFLGGQYMEIGVFELLKTVMEEISARCKTNYRLYRNVIVATKNGRIKNEFDIVIECEGIFYVVEVKSGKHFNSWGDLLEVGKEFSIVPDRLLLVDSYLSDIQAKRIESFCKYYVSNLNSNSFREKVTEMISNDR